MVSKTYPGESIGNGCRKPRCAAWAPDVRESARTQANRTATSRTHHPDAPAPVDTDRFPSAELH
jgi:hypothetical protein